jgi:hypothetical protein
MEDKKVTLAKLDFDFGSAVSDIAKLSDEIVTLKKANADLKKEGKESSEVYQANAVKLRQLGNEYRVQQKVITDFNTEKKEEIKIIEQTDGSIKQLEAALASNRNAYRLLSKEERENLEVGGQLLKTIQSQDKEYKDLQVSIGTTQVNVGNYQQAVEDAIKSQGGFGSIIDNSITNINSYRTQLIAIRNTFKATSVTVNGTSKAFGILRGAIIATGIGALLIALGGLVALLTKTQKGMDFLKAATAGVGSVFKNLQDISIRIGESLVKAFNDPKKAITDLGKFILDNLINRLQAVGKVITALGAGFSALAKGNIKDLKKAGEDLGRAFVQATTGLDEAQQKKIADGFANTAKEMQAEAKTAFELEKSLLSLEKREAQLAVSRAKNEAEIEDLKKKSDDTENFSLEQREAFARRAIALETGLLATQIAISKEKVRIFKEQNKLSTSTEAELQKVRDAEIELAGFQKQSLTLQTELNNKINSLSKEQAAIKQAQLDKENEIAAEKLALEQEKIKAEEEAIAAVIERNQTELQALNQKFLDELVAIGAGGEEQKALTEQQFKALQLLQKEHEESIAQIKKDAFEKELDDRIATDSEAFKRQQVLNTIQLNQELLLLGDNEEAKEKLRREFEIKNLNDTKKYLEEQFQVIQAALSQDLLADAGLGFADAILSDEEKQELEDRLNSVSAQISEIALQIGEATAAVMIDGKSPLQNLLGFDDESFEKFQEGIGIALESVEQLGAIVSDAIGVRTSKQIAALDKLRANDSISAEEYEKRKEAIEKKAFERNKKIQATLATVNYLQGVINILAAPSTIPQPFDGIYRAVQLGILSASYGVNLAKIKNQKFEEGGLIEGNSHSQGGVPFTVQGRGGFEAEGGEYIVNKQATKQNMALLEAINASSGGFKNFAKFGSYADGGIVASSINRTSSSSGNVLRDVFASDEFAEVLTGAIAAMPPPELNIVELATEQSRQVSIKELARV